jgi:hypothetical protein
MISRAGRESAGAGDLGNVLLGMVGSAEQGDDLQRMTRNSQRRQPTRVHFLC